MTKPRRARQFVDFEVQYVLLRKVAVHWTLFMLSSALALTVWIRLFTHPLEGWSGTLETLIQQYTPIFIVSVACLPVFLLDTIKLSNRFSGPIVRLRNNLNAIAAGEEIKPLAFRKGDFWQSLATDFNKAIEITSNPSSNQAVGNLKLHTSDEHEEPKIAAS